MSDTVGAISHEDGLHTAQCAKCPEKFESRVDGKVAHELMEHNQEEHAA